MSFAFPQYVKIKDNYCCCYLGNTAEYIVQLKLLRPHIEKQLPGLHVYIACKDNFYYLIEDEPRTVRSSEMKDLKHLFAYVRNISFVKAHPILSFIQESQLEIPVIATPTITKGTALICPEGILPTQSLTLKNVEMLKQKVKSLGYDPIVIGSDIHATLLIDLRPYGKEKLEYIKSAAMVIGVENEYLFLAGGMGKDTTLIPTGLGAELYKKMFPENKILKI